MTLHLAAYFRRIGFDGSPKPDLATLRALHLAHATSIPFENLSIHLGEGISLALEALQDKLVQRRRGGYCFEQNTLFLTVLRELGFEAEAYEARVRGGEVLRPRTHMLLRVRLPEGDHLADVGFGGEGLLHPVLLDGEAHPQFGRAYRVVESEGLRVLQSRQLVNWVDLYAFELVPRLPVDFQVANWYTSTHPDSIFVKTLTAQRVMPDGRLVLRNLSFTEVEGEHAEERMLHPSEVPGVLRERFGIDLPETARFRVLEP